MIELTFSVYKHTSPSGKSYIGQTSNYDRRCKEHRGSKGKAFGTAIKKYGWDSFTHHVLVAGLTLDDANDLEELCISVLGTLTPHGYNLRTGGANSLHCSETRMKMSKVRKGNKHALGFVHSAETRAKVSMASKGRVFSSEHKEKIAASNKGQMRSADTCARTSLARIGSVHSEETRAKIGLAAKSHVHSAEHRAKISVSNTGRILSSETRAKMSLAQKARRANAYVLTHP
jgi:group I intron endonuclease